MINIGQSRSLFLVSHAPGIAVAFVLAVASALPAQTPLPAWVDRYDGPAHLEDYGEGVTVDEDGNVFVVGFTFQSASSLLVPRFLTIKYGQDGARLWTSTYTTGTDYGSAHRIVTDSTGAAIISGIVQQSDWTIVKYSAAGTQQWARVRDTGATAMTGPSDLEVGSDDSVYVGGYDVTGTIVKYDAAGIEQWTRQYTAAPCAFLSTAIDATDNVYAAGTVNSGTLANEAILVKYTASGALAWARTFGTPGTGALDRIARVEIAPDQSVIVAGTLGEGTPTGTDVVTRRYDSAGNLLWSQTLGITPNRDESVFALTITADGGIVVGGDTTLVDFSTDTLVARYSLDGVLEWTAIYGGPYADWCRQLAHDANGGVYAAGVRGTGNGTYEYQCVRFSPTGQQVWEQFYSDGSSTSVLTGIAVGPDDRVTATGRSLRSGGMDAATIQYHQIDASPFVRGDANGDGLFDIADPILTVAFLFSGATTGCLAANDSTADDLVDIADPIHSLGILFGSGSSLPAPHPACGIVGTAEVLGCDDSGACP